MSTEENQTPQTTPPPADEAAGALVPQEQRTMGMLCHLLSLIGLVVPFGNIIGPLVMWLIKKDEMPFVDDQGKESLNFQITVSLVVLTLIILGTVLMIVLIGFLFFLLIPVVGIGAIVLVVIASIKANEGVHYRYPFTLRLIK